MKGDQGMNEVQNVRNNKLQMDPREMLAQKRHVKRGEVYWTNIREQNGSVQKGRRLVLIIQNDIGNTYSTSTIVIPFTTKLLKRMLPTHLFLKDELPKPSILLCEQIMTMDTTNLSKGRPVTILDEEIMKRVDKMLKISLGID